MSRCRFATCLLLPVLVAAPAVLPGQTRLIRHFTEEAGLVPPVWAMAQDSSGFLWVGSQGGLSRYDGSSLRAWSLEDDQASAVIGLATHGDVVVAVTDAGGIFEIAGGEVHSLRAPGPPAPRTVRKIAFDANGVLWTIRGTSLVHRTLGGEWQASPDSAFGGERPIMVREHPDGGVLMSTDRGVWQITADGTARKVLEWDHVVDILATGDRVMALRTSGEVMVRDDNSLRTLNITAMAPVTAGARAVALAQRGRTLWVAFDRFLVALGPGRKPDVITPDDGIEAGGPMLVDREGSLWMGTFTSLLQFPEPDTRIWTEREGLPSRHVRFLARARHTLWITTWQGAARLRHDSSGTSPPRAADWFSQEQLCPDTVSGMVWASSSRGLIALAESGIRRSLSSAGQILGCAPARKGGIWITTPDGLFRVTSDSPPVVSLTVPDVAGTGSDWQAVLEDRGGRIWLARSGNICSRLLHPLGEWQCRAMGETGEITALVELPSGTIWASTMEAGVLRLGKGGRWDVVPENRNLPTDAILNLRPSSSGGVWLLGHGIVRRVTEAGDGWRTVEELGSWNGLPVTSGEDLLEDADGSLWISTALGLVEIPASARFATADPPPVAIADASVDGRTVPADQPFEAPSRHNTLELRFAALSFRDPALVRYQARLGADRPWTDTRGAPSFRWVDLPPGRYTAQFRASLDGQHWSPTPASVRFRVPPPWYLEPWVLAAALILLGAIAFAIYRARVNILLGLERQRTRIAMDLHDEIGSGLGSIGILASILSDTTRDRDSDGRLTREMAATAEHLGESLSDIVWALDPRAADLHELFTQLAQHGNRLFAADDGPEFVVALPDQWPAGSLSLAIRRTVLLIGLEALHNAARHSSASRVMLRLEEHGSHWRLSVEDDGQGIRLDGGDRAAVLAQEVPTGGRGLASMRRRAEEIGAELVVRAEAGRGTTVRLDFRLK